MMSVEIRMIHRRCYRCHRWFGSEEDSVPCGACAGDDINQLKSRVSELRRSNASLRGALKRKAKRRKS